MKILLKNMCRNVGGHLIRGVCSDAAEAVAWVDALNTEAGEARFGFCVDMGVCNVCGQDLNEYITPLGNRVKAVILQDGMEAKRRHCFRLQQRIRKLRGRTGSG